MHTEQDFLANYRMEDYARPSVTSDVAVFRLRAQKQENLRKDPKNVLSLLLIKRGGHPFKDHWALPGGFLSPGETIEECALREVMEETAVRPASLMSIGLFSAPGRDPRGWIISNAFVSVIGSTEETQRSGDDAADARWFDVDFSPDDAGNDVLTLTNGDISLRAVLTEQTSSFGMTSYKIKESGSIAFDHAAIIGKAMTALRSKARDFDVIFDFLPEKFTLAELQNVQEAIMNISVLSANFRRKVASLVTETDEYTEGSSHRPAQLFRKK